MSDDNCRTRLIGMHETCCDPAKPSRRGILVAGATLGGGAVAGLLAGEAAAAVLSLDPQVGDFERGDVLIEGKKISRARRYSPWVAI